ncbi:MAG: hypothetical protein HYS87_00350 [Candidatus Colwellbacteria bacterium]|nr:hypothetical protein [Candidatus Colwellbacteria bacterium]
MAVYREGHDHVIKRKREHKEYRTQIRWKNFLDRIIYPVSLIGPVMTLPQWSKIWIEKNVDGVSAVSWGAYMVVSAFWIIYGITHKTKPLVFINILWMVLHFSIVLGVLIYR